MLFQRFNSNECVSGHPFSEHSSLGWRKIKAEALCAGGAALRLLENSGERGVPGKKPWWWGGIAETVQNYKEITGQVRKPLGNLLWSETKWIFTFLSNTFSCPVMPQPPQKEKQFSYLAHIYIFSSTVYCLTVQNYILMFLCLTKKAG